MAQNEQTFKFTILDCCALIFFVALEVYALRFGNFLLLSILTTVLLIVFALKREQRLLMTIAVVAICIPFVAMQPLTIESNSGSSLTANRSPISSVESQEVERNEPSSKAKTPTSSSGTTSTVSWLALAGAIAFVVIELLFRADIVYQIIWESPSDNAKQHEKSQGRIKS